MLEVLVPAVLKVLVLAVLKVLVPPVLAVLVLAVLKVQVLVLKVLVPAVRLSAENAGASRAALPAAPPAPHLRRSWHLRHPHS